MSDYEFTLPVYDVKKKSKHITSTGLTLNWYANSHYHNKNNAKKKYKEIMKDQILNLDPIKKGSQVSIHYKYYAKRRGTDLSNFTSIAKKFFEDALVELGFLEDDNTNVIIRNSEEFAGIDKDNPRIMAYVKIISP